MNTAVPASADPPVIAVLGLHHESSTFSPHRSTAADFRVTTGEQVLARYPWWTDRDCDLAGAADWHGILHAVSLPGGPLDAASYARWRQQIVDGLSALAAQHPIDGVLLDIHGAMTVEGQDDLEGDLVTAVRAVVGEQAILSAAMDLHGNVSTTLFEACDLLTCYRTAPHVDVWETRERAARNLVSCLRSQVRPVRALVHLPILLPGEMTSTRDEPAATLYSRIPELVADPGVIDAALWVGFAWADQPRCSAAVVVSGTDTQAVTHAAQEWAAQIWAARREFAFVAPAYPMAQALEVALAAISDGARPFFISDTGDNPGAGGADDVTVALAALLDCSAIADGRVRAAHVSLCDPAAIAALADHRVGDDVQVSVGGRVDDRAPGPITLRGALEARAVDPDGGECVSIRVGGLSVVATERRMQFNLGSSSARLGLDPVDAGIDLVVVKMGYLEPDLHAMAAGRVLALTPGGVDQDLARLDYRRITRPMFPVDDPETAELPLRLAGTATMGDNQPDDLAPET